MVLRPGMPFMWEGRRGPERGTVVEVNRTRAVVCIHGKHRIVAAALLRPDPGGS
ncbi:MAG: hypothetical protein HYY18_03470 [Planctomycetes bacterium]|nr:hypothetical protein [Planctomycetota bacterium]